MAIKSDSKALQINDAFFSATQKWRIKSNLDDNHWNDAGYTDNQANYFYK